MIDARRYRYAVEWSGADEQFVGTCADFPSLSWLADDHVAALEGVVRLVADTLEDMQRSGESLPAPTAASEMTDLMTGKELQALRKFLLLDVKEAADIIGKVSPRSWQYWEAGRSSVPDDVADKMNGLLGQRQMIIESIEAQVEARSDNPPLESGSRLKMPYYSDLTGYQKDHPGEGVISWRAYQSAVAELYANNIIVFSDD